jgi:rsbT antagonist protein RsbS
MSDELITVMKLRDILMVAMPADPDDATITALQEQVLQAMGRFNAKALVLDISAVESLDSFFARTVVETARMVGLMGGETVIAGMRPSVAITATQLGFTLLNVMTALDVDRAMDILSNPRRRKGGR